MIGTCESSGVVTIHYADGITRDCVMRVWRTPSNALVDVYLWRRASPLCREYNNIIGLYEVNPLDSYIFRHSIIQACKIISYGFLKSIHGIATFFCFVLVSQRISQSMQNRSPVPLVTLQHTVCFFQKSIYKYLLHICSVYRIKCFKEIYKQRLFACTPLMIQWIVRIWEVVDWFLYKLFWFFPKDFLNLRSDMTEK